MLSMMKSLDILKTPSSVKIITLTIFSLTFFIFLFTRYSSSTTISSLTFFSPEGQQQQQPSPPPPPPLPLSPPPPPPPQRTPKPFIIPPLPPQERIGLIDENGFMTDNFTVSNNDDDESLLNWNLNNITNNNNDSDFVVEEEVKKVKKYTICKDVRMVDYIPCLDNFEEIAKFSGSERGEKYERHCPKQDKGLNCVVPRPKGYRKPILWPKSRDEVRYYYFSGFLNLYVLFHSIRMRMFVFCFE